MNTPVAYTLALSLSMFLATAAQAEDYVLTIKNHQFTPKELVVPAGQRARITVKNQDPTPAEFESSDLNREKVVGANAEITLFVGPLDAGRYGFFDDFHRETTTGVIVAK